MTSFQMVDLEAGISYWTLKYKRQVEFLKQNKVKLKRSLIVFLVLFFAMTVKLSISNFDVVAQTASAITMDEKTYVPFHTKLFNAENKNVQAQNYHIKESTINRQMQKINLDQMQSQIQAWLEETNNVCVHAKYFDIPFDIIVFQNQTVINPYILEESLIKKNIREISIDGHSTWKRRSLSVYLKYTNQDLEIKYEKLWLNQAYCLMHYLE